MTMKLTNKLLFAFGLGFASNALAENPIIQTYYSPDPAPVVFGDTVCVYTGNDEGGSFFTMHGWRVSCTTDMVNWTDMGELILTNESCGGKDKKNGDWAAQVVRRNGKYYYTSRKVRSRMLVMVSILQVRTGITLTRPFGLMTMARLGSTGATRSFITPSSKKT